MYFICIYRSYLLFLLCRLQNKISTTIYTLNPIADIMAKVKPFRGVRPPRELVTEVASRPYDVLNSAEARAEAEEYYRAILAEKEAAAGLSASSDSISGAKLA